MNTMEAFRKIAREDILRDYRYRGENLGRLNRAFAKMLNEEGLLSDEDYRAIDRGLVSIQKKVAEEDIDPDKGDIHFLYEQALFGEIGAETGSRLHVGRSRNDMYFTLWRMSVREALQKAMAEILELQRLLEIEAAKNLETVIPYYTYGQPSQPGTWGHYLMSIHELLAGDLRRMRAAYKTVNRCPMGAAAGIGTAFAINKSRLCELLGFDSVIDNTLTAISAVDYYLETECALAVLNTTLSRVSSDFMFFASAECGILNCDTSICGGSSIMPQKKNAEAVEIIRARSTQFPGYLMSSLMAAGSATLFPSHETYAFFDRFWENVNALIENMQLFRLVLEHSHIEKDTARNRARDGFTAATAMAESLAIETGEPFTKNHHVVGGMIHALMDENRLCMEQMTPELLKQESLKVLGYEVVKTDEELAGMLDPLASLDAKAAGGTPKPEDTRLLLENGRRQRLEDEAWLQRAVMQVEDGYGQIDCNTGK